MSMVALLQHLGSKQKVTNSNPRPLAARHVSLLDDIADIFVGEFLLGYNHVSGSVPLFKLFKVLHVTLTMYMFHCVSN